MKNQKDILAFAVRSWMNANHNGAERVFSNLLCGTLAVSGISLATHGSVVWLLSISLCIPIVLWTKRRPGWTFITDIDNDRVGEEFLERLAGNVDIHDQLKALVKTALDDKPDLTYSQMLRVAEVYDSVNMRAAGAGYQALKGVAQR